MRIAFYCNHPYYGGLNNNGGTRTIVRSAATLRSMGHKVDIVACADKYTWEKHPKVRRKLHPETDRIIAASVSDVEGAVRHKPKKAKVFWWCRLLEAYQMPKSKILKRAGMVEVLVNSQWLRSWFKKNGIPSRIVYQGLDVADWTDDGFCANDKPIIGFLLSKKPRKQFYQIKKIVQRLGTSYQYVGFGAKGDLNDEIKMFITERLACFKTNPSHAQLDRLYNMADIWLATSSSEGLHNPPMEAALCGCLLVCNGAPAGGTADYCVGGETGIVYKKNDPEDAVLRIRNIVHEESHSYIDAAKKLVSEKIGTRQIAMERLLEAIR